MGYINDRVHCDFVIRSQLFYFIFPLWSVYKCKNRPVIKRSKLVISVGVFYAQNSKEDLIALRSGRGR